MIDGNCYGGEYSVGTDSPVCRYALVQSLGLRPLECIASSNGKIFRVTGPMCGWIPPTKASDAELWCFFLICAWINDWVNNHEAVDPPPPPPPPPHTHTHTQAPTHTHTHAHTHTHTHKLHCSPIVVKFLPTRNPGRNFFDGSVTYCVLWCVLKPFEARTKWLPFSTRHVQRHFLEWNYWIYIEISFQYVPRGPINIIPALVRVMAWRRLGDQPLSGPLTA